MVAASHCLDRRNFLALTGVGVGAALAPRAAAASTSDVAIPTCHEADVCVLGGSCTGVFAAVRAAEQGMTVAIVENEGFFGGTAVGGYVPVWHSLYDTTGTKQIIFGLTDRILRELVARGEAVLKNRDNPSVGS